MTRQPLYYLIPACLVGVGVLVFFSLDRDEQAQALQGAHRADPEAWVWPDAGALAARPEAAQRRELRRAFEQAVVDISADPSQAAAILSRLERYVESLPADVAGEVVLSILNRPELDVRTGLGFAVGGKGRLRAAPSLRVALLDWLGQLDPAAAGRLAERIFDGTTEPDEFAISLRNHAWANPRAGNHAYLRGRARELVTKPEWIGAPSAGTLEAFDVFVYARATDAAAACHAWGCAMAASRIFGRSNTPCWSASSCSFRTSVRPSESSGDRVVEVI